MVMVHPECTIGMLPIHSLGTLGLKPEIKILNQIKTHIGTMQNSQSNFQIGMQIFPQITHLGMKETCGTQHSQIFQLRITSWRLAQRLMINTYIIAVRYVLCINICRLTGVVFFLPVDVLLKAVGDTPIMKTKKWAVERGRTVQSLAQFISRFLKFEASEQLVPFTSSHTQSIQ